MKKEPTDCESCKHGFGSTLCCTRIFMADEMRKDGSDPLPGTTCVPARKEEVNVQLLMEFQAERPESVAKFLENHSCEIGLARAKEKQKDIVGFLDESERAAKKKNGKIPSRRRITSRFEVMAETVASAAYLMFSNPAQAEEIVKRILPHIK